MIEPEYGDSLADLYNQWSQCTKCELGQRRAEVSGAFVFGEGYPGGIMFVGEGPGATEELEGRPFVGKSGEVLRNAIASLNLTNFYITNVVSCRSCKQAYTSEGQPIVRTNRRTGQQEPVIKDEAPTPTQAAACYQRLCGEIHHVDPLIIVALGLEATKVLCADRVTSMRQAKSEIRETHIPGKLSVPSRTAAKQMWERRVRGQVVRPTVRNMVRYKLIPTYHPSYLLRFKSDKTPDNPVEIFARDMRMAAMIYDRTMLMAHNVLPSEREVSADFIREVM
jgi:uracil-DNA glycosylase